jgi:hypothetical protein
VRRGRDLRDATEQLDIRRGVIEIVVADDAAIRLSAELIIFFAIDLLEDRTLVPSRSLEFS